MNKLPDDFSIDRYGLHCRLVHESDAEFIVRVRSDLKLCRYIHSTGSINDQIKWIRRYKEREIEGRDYYFIFEYRYKPIGLYRIYDIQDDSFVCGSWVFDPESPKGAAALGNIIGREIAYENLCLNTCYTDVLCGNTSSLQFQRMFKPIILDETDQVIRFQHVKENFYKLKESIIRMFIRFM